MIRHGLTIALAVTLVTAATETFARHEKTVGNSAVVVKTVTGKIGPEVRTLVLNDDVYHNELIETKEESATEIIFLDSTRITLGEESQVILDRFIYDPNPTRSEFVLTISKGAMRFVSGNLPSESYTIHTPSGTVGIRGTIVDFYIERVVDVAGRDIWRTEVTFQDGVSASLTCDGDTHVLDRRGQSLINQGDGVICSAPDKRPQSAQSWQKINQAILEATSASPRPDGGHEPDR